jgi:signal transduction histidine kinase
MISHEFRTPLAIIDAAAQRIVRAKDKVNTDYLGEKTLQIKSAVSRMVGLMESILATGRMETGTLSVTKRPVSLAKLIEETASRRQEISPLHKIHVDIGRLPDSMMLDRDAMERVFTNLLSNAVKYAPDATDIHVKALVRQGCAVVAVSDNGIGIDAEDVPRIFDPYFRARSARGIAGTGIGLNIVREIVNLHGGSISVSSAIGMGTTFEITLPLDDACADLHGAKE